MDIIAFNEASTANGRIESFIENPDSASGIVTVPKVIASGETVTIPAGRVAVLPNVTVDGTLNIENGGEVFIPSGATLGDLDAQLALKAPLVNPAFTNPTATTQTAQDNSTKVATTAYVDGKMVLGTAVNTTSGTSIDFTGIPIWVKKITVLFNGVRISGVSGILVQLGDSGGIENTGYVSSGNTTASTVGTIGSNTGFIIRALVSSFTTSGSMTIINQSNNNFISSHSVSFDTLNAGNGGGSKTLSETLNIIRITTANGIDTFNAGSINIMYEG